MATPADVIKIAIGDIGYTESPAGSNRTKFAKIAGHASGYAWCATWVVAVLKRAGMTKLVCDGAYTPTHANEGKKQGRTVSLADAAPGDVVLFDFPRGRNRIEHVGLVEKNLGGGKLACIEGNTSGGGSQTNGGAVMRKTRNMKSMAGYVIYRPYYDGTPAPAGAAVGSKLDDDLINLGDQGQAVVIWQQQLRDGFGLSDLIADGDFGPATEKATKAFQAAQGLTVDGQVGPATIKAMEALYAGKSAGPAKVEATGAGHLEEAVRYAGEGDIGAAQLLGTSLDLHVGNLDARQTVGVVHLVGGPAIRDFDRSLAKGSIVEHPGAGRAETLDGVKRYIAERKG